MKKNKQSILKFSAVLLAATLVGGVQAASDGKKDTSSTTNKSPPQQQEEQARPKLTDGNIQSAVEKKLKQLDGIDSSKLKVATSNRTVTVTGTVDSLIEGDRVMEAVSALRGVDNAVASFTVEPEKRSDQEIQRDVDAALDFDPATASKDISVTVNNGEVRLTGKMDTWSAKQLATRIASDVRGVRKINNDLTVASQARSAAEIKDALEKRFRSDPLVSDDISVAVTNGRVRLSGEVRSALEKRWAVSDARTLNIAEVDASQLRVNPEGGDVVPPSDKMRTDETIASSIREAYMSDPRVFSFNPEVKVSDGTVELSGSVDNLKAKQAAVQIAQNTAGVQQVRDKLSIAGQARSDADVTRELRAALERSSLLQAKDVTVNVNSGKATLTGTVDGNFEKWAAGDIAARTRGVNEVQNQLVSDDRPEFTMWEYYYPWHSSYYPWTYSYPDQPKTDSELRAEVREQLMWSPFTDGEDISISVADGVVTLTGQVDDRMEKGAAEDNAYQAGAKRVKNQLVVLDSTVR